MKGGRKLTQLDIENHIRRTNNTAEEMAVILILEQISSDFKLDLSKNAIRRYVYDYRWETRYLKSQVGEE